LHVTQTKARELKVQVERAQEAVKVGAAAIRERLVRLEVAVLVLAVARALIGALVLLLGLSGQRRGILQQMVCVIASVHTRPRSLFSAALASLRVLLRSHLPPRESEYILWQSYLVSLISRQKGRGRRRALLFVLG
jgi:hypothetical protein